MFSSRNRRSYIVSRPLRSTRRFQWWFVRNGRQNHIFHGRIMETPVGASKPVHGLCRWCPFPRFANSGRDCPWNGDSHKRIQDRRSHHISAAVVGRPLDYPFDPRCQANAPVLERRLLAPSRRGIARLLQLRDLCLSRVVHFAESFSLRARVFRRR